MWTRLSCALSHLFTMKLASVLVRLLALPCWTAAYTPLSDEALQSLPGPGHDFDIVDGAILSPILQTRVPGTPGSLAVLQHFVDFFRQNLPDWNVTFQNSSQATSISNGKLVPFVNFIATRDPPWATGHGDVGRLALVAHYDSKLTPKGFIGAIDSAAPCAMILHAARSIDLALTQKWNAMAAAGLELDSDLDGHKGVQILLLDGEEAFLTWTDEDSIYGARSLAEEWDQFSFGAFSNYKNALGTIDLFVLLDLLGSANPTVPSMFKTTHWAYRRMAEIEQRLRKLKKFRSLKSGPFLPEYDKTEYDQWHGGAVGDDHVPFMARGVDVLHLIPLPFPAVWHTINDDGEHLDANAVEDWATLTTAFAAEWLDLEGHMNTRTSKSPAEFERHASNEHEKTEL
jgi:hypothetical protein